MTSRLLRRRTATAAATYLSAVLGVAGMLVAARRLGPHDFGLFALVLASAGFFQILLDLTAEEALVKYGFRYSAAGEWGRLRRLFRVGLLVKLVGGALACLVLLALAPAADPIFGTSGLLVPFLVAASLPLLQSPENVAASTVVLHQRYDARAWLLALSMGLRLTGLAIGSAYGVTEAVAGIAIAQLLATAANGIVGRFAFSRFPAAPAESLTRDRLDLRRFVVQSSIGTGVVSVRALLTPLLLGLVSTPVQVAYFRAAQAPQSGFALLSSPARLILFTEQTRDWEHGEKHRVFTSLWRFSAAAAALSAVALPLLWWRMPDVIDLLFGGEYAGAVDPTRLILLAAGIQLVLGWTKSLPVSIGRPLLRVWAHGIEAIVLIPLAVVLGWKWGATGAAAATLIATGVFAAVWAALLVRLAREHRTPSEHVTPQDPVPL
jgi:O-antigen/teichoic acid export membrane protein